MDAKFGRIALCALIAVLAGVINVQAQGTTINCTAKYKKSPLAGFYEVWGEGTYTYAPSPGWMMTTVFVDYGQLDKDGKLVEIPETLKAATVDKTKLTWTSSANPIDIKSGEKVAIRARLQEQNQILQQTRYAVTSITEVVVP